MEETFRTRLFFVIVPVRLMNVLWHHLKMWKRWPLLTGSLTIPVLSGIVWSVGDSSDVVHKVIKLQTWQSDVCAIHLCCDAMMPEHSAAPCLALWRPPAQHRIIGYNCRLWLIQLFAFVIIQESCPLELGLIRLCLCVFLCISRVMFIACWSLIELSMRTGWLEQLSAWEATCSEARWPSTSPTVAMLCFQKDMFHGPEFV